MARQREREREREEKAEREKERGRKRCREGYYKHLFQFGVPREGSRSRMLWRRTDRAPLLAQCVGQHMFLDG